MLIPQSVASVFITDQLHTRIPTPPEWQQEKLALQDLARLMVEDPNAVLPKLVDLALELCGAMTGGLSIYEKKDEVFRWHHLRGTLAAFTGATTPRNYSPCGITLDIKMPTLVARPELVYSWVADAGISLAEVLLVPLSIGANEPLGTLWIAADEPGHFTLTHSQTLKELAAFTGIALQMIQSGERLSAALAQQETLALEMGHRVKNLFAITDSMIRLTARGATTKDDFANTLSSRIHALATANSLVRKSFNVVGEPIKSLSLRDVISVVLAPYDHAHSKFDGENVPVGEQATNALAMIFHELATNAAKYGAFHNDGGSLSITWTCVDGNVQLDWIETIATPLGGIPLDEGFGSKLVTSSVQGLNGSVNYEWPSSGLHVTMTLSLAALAR